MTRAPAYPKYRDGDSQWLPPAPEHWVSSRVKFTADVLLGKMLQNEPEEDDDVKLPYARAASVGQDGFLVRENPKDMWFSAREVAGLALAAGDILVVEGGDAGRSILLREDVDGWGFQNSINRARARHGVDPRFLHYFLLAVRATGFLKAYCDVVSIPHLTAEKLKRVPIAVPPHEEQRLIANYLDRETGEIDTLIADQGRLVEMLKERRKAVIERAVTKGISGAPTVHSGLQWAGHMPKHWSVKRISWMFASTGSGTTPEVDDIVEPSESTVPWVTTGELREKTIASTVTAVEPATVDALSALRIYPAGTLLMAMYGATIGRLAVLGIPAVTNQACCAMYDPQDTHVRYVEYALLAARKHLVLMASGGGQPNINQEKVRSLRLPFPPLGEQRRIAGYVDEQTAKIDILISKAERFIALSKERRSALITAVVTGQIDVREQAAAR